MDIRKYYDEYYDYQKDLNINWPRLCRMLAWFDNCSGLMCDAGCGIGASYFWAKRHNISWNGFDISEVAIEFHDRFLQSKAMEIGDMENIKTKDNSYNLVCALGSLEHCNNPMKALSELYRITKPNGRAIIVVPNKSIYKTEQIQELMLTKEQWQQIIEQAGFRVCGIKKDSGPAIRHGTNLVKKIQRSILKLTVLLPDCLNFQWIFNCKKDMVDEWG